GEGVVRNIRVAGSAKPLTVNLMVGVSDDFFLRQENREDVEVKREGDVTSAVVASRPEGIEFWVTHGNTKAPVNADQVRSRWHEEVVTQAKLSKSRATYVVDDIELPMNNPWKRNVRPGDIQFKRDGTGVMVTLDGDVWLVRGLKGDLEAIRWKRFTSGLHEPMTLAIRDDEIFVFDKNGIWKLIDRNGDEEADVHELFSNAFAQTIDMREFPTTIRNAPDGEFVIAKGGQQKTYGKHNGSILRVSKNGNKATLLGYGFRQPAIGVNIRTGLVTSGDQEGNYIPSSPLHEVRDGQFYGYIDDKVHGREKYPDKITQPMTWMPHAVNASAISQVWLFDAKMGALNDQMVHIGFTRPELFKVMLNDRGPKLQAALTSITTDFQHPPLNGSVNPSDGQMYVAGFQVQGWGNVLNRLVGMSRVRYTGRPVTLPEEVVPMDQGILIRFGVELDPVRAASPANYSLATWHYQRTPNYGSAQYKANGEPGIEFHAASSAYLSGDGKSVFIGVPKMKPVMQLRVGWSLATKKGKAFEKNAYTTPHSLAKFDAKAEGFGDLKVDLTPRELAKQKAGPVTFAEGKRLYGLLGCIACHSVNGDTLSKVGPTWMGLFESERDVVINRKRQKVKADLAYLRESILDPTAKIVRGFEKGEYAMPSYAGVVTDSQIEALLLYIEGVKDGDTEAGGATKIDASKFE
ncbi:MAG: c-type cytochrome, partial [Limisphaerales bacterium]